MPLLSKIDCDLLQVFEDSTPQNPVNLFVQAPNEHQGSIDHNQATDTGFYLDINCYSNSIELQNDNILAYQLSSDTQQLSLYSLNDPIHGKFITIHLPDRSMNKNHTMTVLVDSQSENVLICFILADSSFLRIRLPVGYLIPNGSVELPEDWYDIQKPYDFSVRTPHLLFSVTPDYCMVFLDDGGLLGLKKSASSYIFEPVLFNDGSYLQNISRIFSRKRNNIVGKVVSCTVFNERYLLTLTEQCQLKIWDIPSVTLINSYDMSQCVPNGKNVENGETQRYSGVGKYLALFSNHLVVYCPMGNGVFQVGTLSIDFIGMLSFKVQAIIPANLPTTSLWFLADMQLTISLDLDMVSSYLDLVLLWRCGSQSKVQVLNIQDEGLREYLWIETTTKSVVDSQPLLPTLPKNFGDQADDSFDLRLFTLKSCYAADIFKHAQGILRKYAINVNEDSKWEYLANLETVLRDLNAKRNETCSLTILRDTVILVNTLTPFNHSIYKPDLPIANLCHSLHDRPQGDGISKFLSALEKFTSTLSKETQAALSESFVHITTSNLYNSQTLKENFSNIFKEVLQDQLIPQYLEALFNELNDLDVPSILDDLIQNYFQNTDNLHGGFVESLTPNALSKVLMIQNLYQIITIQQRFVSQILMVFVLLDSDVCLFEKQLDTLLRWNYQQLLFMRLYLQNKVILSDIILDIGTQFHHGAKIYSYSEWNSYIQHLLSVIYSVELETNPLLHGFLKKYVVFPNSSANQSTNKIFLHNIGELFFLHENKLHQLLYSMLLFVCGEYNKSFETFQLYDNHSDLEVSTLPTYLKDLVSGSSSSEQSSMWASLLATLNSPTARQDRFNYQLSRLYSDYCNAPELSLKAIRKSIELSMKREEQLDIATAQHKQLLRLLIHFNMFSEVIDVLRLSHSFLSISERKDYFNKLLSYPNQNLEFFATLLELCRSNEVKEKEQLLDVEDFGLVDSILSENLTKGDWESYMKLYSFRYINNFRREAAEVIYQYGSKYGDKQDIDTKKKIYLLMINVLATFENTYDQWLLGGPNVITLADLRREYAEL